MKEFDVRKVKEEVVQWIRDFFIQNGEGCNAIVGISGGKDSSVAAALCVEALGRRVVGVLMPQGRQEDIAYSEKLVEFLDIKSVEINIGDSVCDIVDRMFYGNNIKPTERTKINLPARIRMAALYGISESMSGRVINTCNLSEDWVGYATRYGDGAGDFSPLSNLTVTEVKALGRELRLPEDFIEKVPEDGLCGKTDEENLGFTYDVLDKYIRTGICEDLEVKNKIDDMHERSLFKLQLMPSFEYSE